MVQGPRAGDAGRYGASWDDQARLAAMKSVAGLGRLALAIDEPASLMKQAAADVAETMGMPMVVLTELDPGGDKWVVRAGFGWRPGTMDPELLWEPPELVSQALSTAAPVVMGDIAEETRWSIPSDVLADHGVTSAVCVPVVGCGQPSGVLAVFDRVRRAFGPEEVGFITMVAHVLGLAVDRYRREEEVRHDAVHDPLTGLANRVLLADRIDMIVHEFRRTGRRAALVLLDLDGFKNINDTLGHQVGDTVLKRIGERLTSVVRQTDTVARLGGDEFAIVMREAGRREAETVAGKVCDVIAQPLDLDGRPQVRASVGVALLPDCGTDADALLRYADVEMLRAKQLSHALDGTLFSLLESDSIDRLIGALMARDESSSLEF
ncbi:MAG: sensor domain-containing diguanylate cyclase, partial [Actinobacteria bacterium]